MSQPDLPNSDDGWFKRHIIEALNDLKHGHEKMLENQQEMHEANIRRMKEIAERMEEHEESDQESFTKIRQDVAVLMPLQKIVYGAIALILVAFMTALITSVIVGQKPNNNNGNQIQQPGRN